MVQRGTVDNLIGKKFGMLTVIARGENKGGNAMWICKCDCGKVKEKPVYGWSLKSGKTRSCGCLYKGGKPGRVITHGKTHTSLYRRYGHMLERCYSKNHLAYHNYGGRGIKVCDQWKSDFLSFYNWALENGYREDLTLDRIDVDGDYSPENCRWVTAKEQGRNKRNNTVISIGGIEKTLAEWSEESGVDRTTISKRIESGWSGEDLLLPANARREATELTAALKGE